MFRNLEVDAVIARRMARIAFGGVLMAGALILIHQALSGAVSRAGLTLVITWAAAFAAYAVTRQLVLRSGPRSADSLEAASLVVPGIGIAFTLPLLMHLPFAMLLGAGTKGFDDWVAISAIIVGPTHVALAALIALRGWQLATDRKTISRARVYWLAVLVSCVPGLAYLAIPPAIVMLTGLPFITLLGYMDTLVARERAELGAEATAPRAIIHAA